MPSACSDLCWHLEAGQAESGRRIWSAVFCACSVEFQVGYRLFCLACFCLFAPRVSLFAPRVSLLFV